MNNLEQIKELLFNIENLNNTEKKKLETLICYYYVYDGPEYMALYNRLTKEQLKLLFELIGIKRMTDNFIRNIYDLDCLVVPYNRYNFTYESLLKNNPDFALIAFSKPIFYSEFSDIYDAGIFIKSINDNELKRLFANNCIKYIPNIIDLDFRYGSEELFEFVDSDVTISLMKQKKDSDNILVLYKYLSNDKKREVVKEDWFTSVINLNDYDIKCVILENSPDDIIENLLGEEYSFERVLSLFEGSHKLIYLKKCIDKYDDSVLIDDFYIRNIFNNLILISKKTFNSLGDYQSKLISIINSMNEDIFIEYYFKMYLEHDNFSEEISLALFNKAKLILNNKFILLNSLSSGVIKSNNKELLDLVIEHISKEDLLLLSIRNIYINDYVLNILDSNPDFFEGVYIENNDKYGNPNKDYIDNFLRISKYLSNEQLSIYFIDTFIEENNNIKRIYMNSVKNNPKYLSSIHDLKYFEVDDIPVILNGLDINNLMYLVLHKKIALNHERRVEIWVKDTLKNRVGEIANYINNCDIKEFILTGRYGSIFLLLDEESINELINNIDNYDFLVYYFSSCSRYMYNLIYERIITLCDNIEIDMFTMMPNFSNEEDEIAFYNKLSFSTMINFSLNTFRSDDKNSLNYNKMKNYLTNKIAENLDLLLKGDTVFYIDELLSYLDVEYQDKIKKYIEQKFNDINVYDDIKNSLFDYSSKANFILSVENNYINDDNYVLVKNMLNKNKFLFNTMNFRLLSDDLFKMGNYFINKISRHSNMSKRLLKIYDKDINKYNLIVMLSNKMESENNNAVYDEKIESVINYLLNNDIDVPNNIDDTILVNIEEFILDQTINRNLQFKNIEVCNYIKFKNNILDNSLVNSFNIDEVKDIVFQKHFGLRKENIDSFMLSYGFNWASVKDDSLNSYIVDSYIELINKINAINDVMLLKEISLNMPKYKLTDYMAIKSIMINAYNKSIELDIKDKQNGVKTNILINGVSIEVEELVDNFGIFVHSTDAYGSMPLINNNYYDSWNYNPNTKNHGICTSYISNSSYGTTAVKNNGVMFGFTNVDSNSIPLIAPYDLMTINDGFTIKSKHKPLYGRLNTISDYTRHTHNEASFERVIYSESNSYLRQPDALIIFEDMSDQVKENTIKAYEDFKKNGIELKIIYIDRVKVARNEASKLNNMMELYSSSYDLNLLREIINKYESNMCSCDYIGNKRSFSAGLIDQDELFNTNYLVELLYKTLDYIESTNDSDMLNEFINILEHEQYKFNLIKEFNKSREHKFNLYDEKLKQRIRMVLNSETNIKRM